RRMTALADTCSYMRKATGTREKTSKHGPEVASGSLRLPALASMRDPSRRAEASPVIADCFMRRRPSAVLVNAQERYGVGWRPIQGGGCLQFISAGSEPIHSWKNNEHRVVRSGKVSCLLI